MNNDFIFQNRTAAENIPVVMKEVFRYAGIPVKEISSLDDETKKLAETAVEKIRSVMNPRACYVRFDVKIKTDNSQLDATSQPDTTSQPADISNDNTTSNTRPVITFSKYKIESKDLAANLKDCNSIYLFAATLGSAVDKEIQKASRINPALAVMLQAAGAMFIESYCDTLQNELLEEEKKDSGEFVPRYSPGYGDVPLENQKIFFEVLQCEKNLGLTLTDSLLMMPEKSVTAFIGIKSSSLHSN